MKSSELIFYPLGHAMLVVLYTGGVAWILSHGERIFGRVGFIAPLSFLLLFVISATVVGTLVLGRPILLYLDGAKREAFQFFGYTVAWMCGITVLMFLLLAMTPRVSMN